jgi:hypothetical protein
VCISILHELPPFSVANCDAITQEVLNVKGVITFPSQPVCLPSPPPTPRARVVNIDVSSRFRAVGLSGCYTVFGLDYLAGPVERYCPVNSKRVDTMLK